MAKTAANAFNLLMLLSMPNRFLQPCLFVNGFAASKEIRAAISTAQILLDPRQKKEFKQSLINSYPIVPDFMINVCIDSTAEALRDLTSVELQKAVQPGGFDKNRPAFCKTVARSLVKQKAIQDVPILTKKDKATLAEKLVNKVLDKILEGAGDLLHAPEMRLFELEKSLRALKLEMGRWRLLRYRIRERPLVFAATLALCGGIMCSYQYAATGLRSLFPLFATVLSFGSEMWKKITPWIHSNFWGNLRPR